MERIKQHLLSLILFALGLAAFIRGVFFWDPDLGWHLRVGQFILSHGIPLTDPFSYTMPSYHFVDHEWLTNVLLILGYKSIGIYGLSLVFAALFVLALFIVIPKKFQNFSYLPIVLAGSLMLGFIGIRSQVITLFFLSILLRVIFDEELWKKWKYFLPLIFIPWVNLHGGFAIGITLLFVFFITESIWKRKFQVEYFTVFLLSLFFTFLNPYGVGIWHEVWMVTSDNFARWTIAEWLPGILFFDIATLVLFAFSFAFLFIYRKKITVSKIIIYLFLLLMAASSVRHVLLWALSAVLITEEAFFLFKQQIKNNKEGLKRLTKVKKALAVVLVIIFLYEAWGSTTSAINFSVQQYYPVKAVTFLAKQHLQGNLFTTYNFAGFVLWKLPGQKDFIDGRMPSWRRSGNYPNESNYALKDYLKMMGNESFFKKMLKQYDIHYLLLSTPQNSKKKNIPFLTKLENYLEKIVGGNTNFSLDNVDLTKLGMKKIYSDKKFVIYQN